MPRSCERHRRNRNRSRSSSRGASGYPHGSASRGSRRRRRGPSDSSGSSSSSRGASRMPRARGSAESSNRGSRSRRRSPSENSVGRARRAGGRGSSSSHTQEQLNTNRPPARRDHFNSFDLRKDPGNETRTVLHFMERTLRRSNNLGIHYKMEKVGEMFRCTLTVKFVDGGFRYDYLDRPFTAVACKREEARRMAAIRFLQDDDVIESAGCLQQSLRAHKRKESVRLFKPFLCSKAKEVEGVERRTRTSKLDRPGSYLNGLNG